MTAEETEARAHAMLYAAVAMRMAQEMRSFTDTVAGKLSRGEVADILGGIAAGLKGLDVGPAGAIAWLREMANGLERELVPQQGPMN